MYRVANAFARRIHVKPVQLLERTKYFVQHHSDRSTRLAQAKGAFICTKQLDSSRTYVLLDDVYTTGATIAAAKDALQAAGAVYIIVGIIARQSLD
jgi:predicted amidophosphoribosyltransferase